MNSFKKGRRNIWGEGAKDFGRGSRGFAEGELRILKLAL